MVGSGRSFNEQEFLEKLSEIKGYIISDIESFPNIPYWIIPVGQVRTWWESGRLGPASKVSRKRVLELIKEIGC